MAEFARIPAGSFLMGSDAGADDERPVHRVWVDAFELAVYPVTCAEYGAFLQQTGHTPPRDWRSDAAPDDLPVVGVSWLDCEAYCQWMSRSGRRVRLPTEAEWERAARGELEGRRYPWGDEIPGWIPERARGPLSGPWWRCEGVRPRFYVLRKSGMHRGIYVKRKNGV